MHPWRVVHSLKSIDGALTLLPLLPRLSPWSCVISFLLNPLAFLHICPLGRLKDLTLPLPGPWVLTPSLVSGSGAALLRWFPSSASSRLVSALHLLCSPFPLSGPLTGTIDKGPLSFYMGETRTGAGRRSRWWDGENQDTANMAKAWPGTKELAMYLAR